MFLAMNNAIAFNVLPPVVDRVLAFEKAVDALRHL